MNLEINDLYVKKENANLIYKVVGVTFNNGSKVANIGLELVCGWDYTNPDWNDNQGWVSNKNFVYEVQVDWCLWDYWDEGILQALNNNDFEVRELPLVIYR